MVECRWADEDWVVLAERALWWPRRRTLCIADVHLGKAAAFRAAGVPVPESATAADLARLGALVRRFDAQRLVILGDLIHARSGRIETTMSACADWRARHAALDILLIRGNHDAAAGDPPAEWNIRIENEVYADPDDGVVAFAHFPEAAASADASRRVLCGHIHPAIALHGPVQSLRAPCMWFATSVAVLPAFGSFTGMKVVRPAPGDRVCAIGDDQVVDVTPRRDFASR